MKPVLVLLITNLPIINSPFVVIVRGKIPLYHIITEIFPKVNRKYALILPRSSEKRICMFPSPPPAAVRQPAVLYSAERAATFLSLPPKTGEIFCSSPALRERDEQDFHTAQDKKFVINLIFFRTYLKNRENNGIMLMYIGYLCEKTSK